MWRTMRRLAEDPSSPGDLAAFLALVAVLVVLVAVVVYVALASLIWWSRGRKNGGWGEFVLPYFANWRDWIWERGIAALTAITLAVTFAHKAAVVDAVLEERMTVQGTDTVRPVEETGRELLRLGQEGPAREVIARSLDRTLATHPWLRPKLTTWLVAACVGLLLVYLAVLITLRLKASRSPAQAGAAPGATEDGNPVGLKKLALVGLCLGLLLASPLGALTSDELVDSAVGELRRREDPDKRVVQPACHCKPDASLEARVAALSGEVQRSSLAADSLRDLVGTLADDLTMVRESLSVALGRTSAGGDAAPRSEPGRLEVITSAGLDYVIASRAGTRIRGTERGTHPLPPGEYRVAIPRLKFVDTVVVESGRTTIVQRMRIE